MTSTDTRSRTGVVRPKGYRPDIEGMRAVAIGLVLWYHAGLPFLPGGFVGVDVFFVISGFLITGLLIRELEKNGRVSLSRFYARRAKRLLPATAVVLVATAFLTWLTTPVVQWRSFGLDIVGAATYVVNWVLANRAVDYLAEDVGVSPVQHFWSLAVEEQFYIVWPLLLIAVGWWVAKRSGAHLRPVMLVAILIVIVPSFLWSLYLTGANPERAFFVSTTRLWELGIGAFVAIGSVVWTKVPKVAAIAIGWVGLVAVVGSGMLVTTETAWPGYAALWPTLGTAAVIIAGFSSAGAGPDAVLGLRPAVWVGGLSYSLYLWHWPILISAKAQWGDLGPLQGLAVVAFSAIPAYLSYRYIENPMRFSPALSRSNRLTLSLGANFTAIGVLAGLMLVLVVPSSAAPSGDQQASQGAAAIASPDSQDGGDGGGDDAGSGDDASGAGAAEPGSVASLANVEWFTPTAIDAVADIPPRPEEEGCQVDQVSAEPILCEYGDPDGDVTIAVVGDSKILQWQTVLEDIADEQGWQMISYTKSACAFSSGMQLAKGKPYTSCAQWNEQVLDLVLEMDPDLVLTTNRVNQALEDPDDTGSRTNEAMVEAIVDTWEQLAAADIPVLSILDNPSPGITVYECVADNMDDLSACTFDRETGIESSSAPGHQEAAQRVPGTRTIDIRDAICPQETCVPVIGNVLVYRQTSHITNTYARSLQAVLADKLVPAVEELAR
ncbi:SGNH hydrolase domain-containing protein [soil metagenome]